MSRPETIDDIEVKPIDFDTVHVENIASDGTLIKAYGAFMEAVQKGGAAVEVRYNTAYFTREATPAEQQRQLRDAQSTWDAGKKHYDTLASVGAVEHEYYKSLARQWAEKEGLPYPPEHDVIESIDVMIRDEVTA